MGNGLEVWRIEVDINEPPLREATAITEAAVKNFFLFIEIEDEVLFTS